LLSETGIPVVIILTLQFSMECKPIETRMRGDREIYCCWSANRSEAYAKLRWAGVEKWLEHRAVEAQAQLRSNGGGSQCKSPREKVAARALAPVTVSAW